MTEEGTNEIQPTANENKPEVRKIPIQFIGSPKEYWKIYMINLALTILTLGIYRPWAKIRQFKYLYNHLLVDEIPMNFTAKPIRLLIGQLIVMFFLGLYFYSELTFNRDMTFMLIMGFILLSPLLLWLAYRFFFRYTQWSGVSMSFTASKTDFYLETILRWLISIFIITIPLAEKRWFEFIAKNVFWGNKPLSVKPSLEKLYTGLAIFIGFTGAGVLLFFLFMILLIRVVEDVSQGREVSDSMIVWSFVSTAVGAILYLVFLFAGRAFQKGYTVHAIYHGLKIGEAKLKLKIEPVKLSFQYLKLYMLTLLSFGFAYPYLFTKLLATIANNAHLELPEGEVLITRESEQEDVSAVGVEALDDVGFDIDFDIGL